MIKIGTAASLPYVPSNMIDGNEEKDALNESASLLAPAPGTSETLPGLQSLNHSPDGDCLT